MIEYVVKERNIKTVSQLRSAIVKYLTKGNVFMWNGEPDEARKIADSKRLAEEKADKMIREYWEKIPKRIKRDE